MTTRQQQTNLKARDQAQAALFSQAVKPTERVQYQSRGRLAIVGGPDAIEFAPRLQEKHQVTVVLLHGAEEPSAAIIPVGGREMRIEGYLGNFNLSFGDEGKANYQTLNVDLVLDLSEPPLLDMALLPPGYVQASTDESSFALAESQLAEMRGTFEKPRYFDYDASICAHGRAGKVGCRRCIDACPAVAISALAESIEVNPYLCQGGGVCASVCPTGAIRYNYPAASDTLNRIRSMLQTYRRQGGVEPVLGFIAESDAVDLSNIPENLLLVVVEEVASIGLDVWLAALAYGAQRVVLLDGGSVPTSVGDALRLPLHIVAEILPALGYANDAVQLIAVSSLNTHCTAHMPEIVPATFSGLNEKRRVMFMALEHLYAQGTQPQDSVALTPGAPFGTLEIDSTSCTLCMSCTSVCPTHAVVAGNELPKLNFTETKCVQCGICASACPETAITLKPRLLLDPRVRDRQVTLHEEAALCCVSCGKPFTTQSVVNTMLAKLEGHWMFQNERARRRLLMCEDCRVVDIIQDPEAMEQGFMAPRRQ